jgi:hypothetical protein
VGARTINMTLDIVSRILADAVKRGLVATNPAADRELRLKVGMNPWLREELLAYRTSRVDEPADAPAFPTATGRRRNNDNVNQRVLRPAVRAANELRPTRREPTLPDRVTRHTLRRTYITLMLEAGAAPGPPPTRGGVRCADGRCGSVGRPRS